MGLGRSGALPRCRRCAGQPGWRMGFSQRRHMALAGVTDQIVYLEEGATWWTCNWAATGWWTRKAAACSGPCAPMRTHSSAADLNNTATTCKRNFEQPRALLPTRSRRTIHRARAVW